MLASVSDFEAFYTGLPPESQGMLSDLRTALAEYAALFSAPAPPTDAAVVPSLLRTGAGEDGDRMSDFVLYHLMWRGMMEVKSG